MTTRASKQASKHRQTQLELGGLCPNNTLKMNICISIGTFRSDVAYRVMTENIGLIRKAEIDLQFSSGKLLGGKITEEELEVTGDEVSSDKFLQIIISKIKEDGNVFGNFIEILKEENTRRAEHLANKLIEAYNKCINV